MKINSIKIQNFQSYFNEHLLEFGPGLNLIIGNGGKGKSKLFNAFYWALFGEIYITDEGWCSTENLYFSSHKALHKHEFINKKALHDTIVGDEVMCSVSLDISDDKGETNYYIERSIVAKRLDDGNWDSASAWDLSPVSFKVEYDTRTGTRTISGSIAENKISELFPKEIRGYIWFQGETLNELINFRNKKTMEYAVKHLSYYTYYDKMVDIITKAKIRIEKDETNKLRKLNANNSAMKRDLSRKETLLKLIQLEEEKKERLEKDIQTINIAIQEDDLKVQGLAVYSDLVQKYDDCKLEINKINNQLDRIDSAERKLIPTLWILRGTEFLLNRCNDIVKPYVSKKISEPEEKYLDEPSPRKLREILEDGRCFVCGSSVDNDHKEAVEWILKRLQMLEQLEDERQREFEISKRFDYLAHQIQEYPESLLRSLGYIDKKYQEMEDEIEILLNKRKQQHELKIQYDGEIEEIKMRHGVDPRKEAGAHQQYRSNLKASRSNCELLTKRKDACIKTIDNYKIELAELEVSLEGRDGETGVVKSIPETEWKNITKFLECVCLDVKEKAHKELIQKITERSNRFYTQFTEHDRGYKGKVEIDDDYSIAFDAGLNTSHEDRKKMSIINALLSLNQEALEVYYPFISDAPTSSFDLSTTHKYLMGIKDVFGQSIIMTKDVEVGSDKYMDLYRQKNVSRIYLLESQFYDESSKDKEEPEIFEVSTRIKELK